MTFTDMLRMSMNNLLKRKMRTVLTVMGVVIGVASIVVMLSLGIGLKKSTMDNIARYSSMTMVRVEGPNEDRMSQESGGKKNELTPLNDTLVEEFARIPNVESVDPILNMSVIARTGVYEANLNIVGLSEQAVENRGLVPGQGVLPDADSGELQFFFGNQVIRNFHKKTSGDMYFWSDELPDLDIMNDTIFYVFDTDAYYSSQSDSGQNNGTGGEKVKAPKKYLVPASGILEGDQETFSQNSWYVFCDLETLKTFLKRAFKKNPIPGQPKQKSGKPYKEIIYTSIEVNVDDIDDVSEVQKTIEEMGYRTYADASWIESQQKSMAMIQAVLGGIGAVSLLVAAIGIVNTMMMSIYERTKEIGVMKVLGCDMGNIRSMFLLEAGYIGLLGGVAGLIISYIISLVINRVVGASGQFESDISIIPLWLSGVALIFAVLVGMVSGLLPAMRAMKLSPLVAIKNE